MQTLVLQYCIYLLLNKRRIIYICLKIEPQGEYKMLNCKKEIGRCFQQLNLTFQRYLHILTICACSCSVVLQTSSRVQCGFIHESFPDMSVGHGPDVAHKHRHTNTCTHSHTQLHTPPVSHLCVHLERPVVLLRSQRISSTFTHPPSCPLQNGLCVIKYKDGQVP